MGILVEDNEGKSALQERIAADMRARRDGTNQPEPLDFDVEKDSAMLEGTTKTSRSSWFWGLLVVVALMALLVIFVIK